METVCTSILNPDDFSENVDYNQKEYPLYIRKGFLSHYPNYSAISHWHEDLEFIVILSGHMTYNVNGELTELEAGNGILVNSRQFHHGFSFSHEECEFICILLHPLLLCVNEYFESHYISPVISNTEQPYLPLSRQIPWHREILELLEEIYQCSVQGFDILSIQQMVFTLWVPLYRHFPHAQGVPARQNSQLTAVKKMVSFIQRHYSEPLSLDKIAGSGNVSRSGCSSLFRKYLSQSPVTYLTGYRLNKSLELLLGTDLSVMEIGLEVGFNNASYYSETFKKYYGCTPMEYRKSQRLAHCPRK